MKKYFAVPLAVFFVAACSESSTAPIKSSDLSPSFGKVTPPAAADSNFSALTANDFYNFSGSNITGAAGTAFTTGLESGGIGTASGPATVTSPAPASEEFLGRFTNVDTEARLVLTNGGARYFLKFDLYTIGSWDGKGKQAQNGVFKANVFSVRYLCEGGSTGVIFASTFSNQLTVQQDYPANIALGQEGGNKAATDSYATDALNYRSAPSLSNTPTFRSFGDVSYTLSLAGDNPCGTGNTVTFAFGSSAPNQQSNYDESWGIDNVRIKAGS